MKVPLYTSVKEYEKYEAEFDSVIKNVLNRGDFILGADVRLFEEEAASYLGVKYAVGVASGSDALTLGSDILGFKEGVEVITPTFTFFASASCVVRTGGIPVFVDMDKETFNMDIDQAAQKITAKTKGILPVHLFLQTVDMEKTMQLAEAAELNILEDSAEAFGMKSLYKGKWRSAGTIGDIGIYSFFPTKTLGAYGDAGLMVTDNRLLYEKMKAYRVHGSGKKYHYDYIGYNSRLDTIQAAILRLKLKRIDESISARAAHAEHYMNALHGISEISFPLIREESKEVYYVFNILAEMRDDLQQSLSAAGVETSVYYLKPLHLQECFRYLGYKEGDFPVAEKISGKILALPMHPDLTEDEIDYVSDVIRKFYD